MRLLWFDITQSSPRALRLLQKKFGLVKALGIVRELVYRSAFKNPFRDINKRMPPNRKAKLSQRQMGPLLILYDILRDRNHTEQETLDFLRQLSGEIAILFLQYNIPALDYKSLAPLPRESKLNRITKLTNRFFNAEGDINLDENDNFAFTVNSCYFAFYSQELGYKNIGPLFCAADRMYFDNHQPQVEFKRSITLAEQGEPCDFNFYWKVDK